MAWIKKQHESEDPYFAYVSLNAPHSPYIAPDEYKKRFLDEGYDEKTAGRYGMIENIDDNFGRFVTTLEAWGALENTLLIFMSDNGMANGFKIERNGEPIVPHNAGLRGVKNSPHEGGTHVPAFWYWKGVLEEGQDIDALTAHIDLYRTFSELAGVRLPSDMQKLDGRSLVPLLENPRTDWEDRKLFVHIGRWRPGEMEKAKYGRYAVRTERWRFVDDKKLFDVEKDPFEENDVAALYPEIVHELRRSYEEWWTEASALMVNEGLPTIAPELQPFSQRYQAQLQKKGIPSWEPDTF